MPTTTEAAFAAYEAVRHRLPEPGAAEIAPVAAADLSETADHYDAYLLDAFGVLNVGETAIPGVAQRIEDLRGAGKRVLVVTNAAGYPHAALMEKYARLGFDFAPEDVISSRATLLAALRGEPPRHWGLMATRQTGLRDLEALDLEYIEEDPAAYDRAEGFLMLGSAAWTEERQALLEAALRDRPRPVWVGNPDIVAPRETGFSVEPGHFAHRLADATGVSPRFFGKPFDNIFEAALARLGPGYARQRVVMVGDSLHTDVLGARAHGLGSALIADYGFFAGGAVDPYLERAGFGPDFILPRP